MGSSPPSFDSISTRYVTELSIQIIHDQDGLLPTIFQFNKYMICHGAIHSDHTRRPLDQDGLLPTIFSRIDAYGYSDWSIREVDPTVWKPGMLDIRLLLVREPLGCSLHVCWRFSLLNLQRPMECTSTDQY